jgi:hypothetical protein
VGVRGATMFDIIPEQDSITCIKLDHNGSSTVTLLLDDRFPPGCKETRRVHG